MIDGCFQMKEEIKLASKKMKTLSKAETNYKSNSKQ
jgi:hypothetical protein